MKTIDINMMFWTDGLESSTRERNVKYASKELLKLAEFLNLQNIKCTPKIYDYSPTQIVENSIHIPYSLSVYKRAEKINNILKDSTADLFSVIDCDCFVAKEDYKILADIINSSSIQSCITFDVIDLDAEQTNVIVETDTISTDIIASSRFPGRAGMLGAFFITNTNNLITHEGFNTKFNTWGGEDGEIYDKIWRDGNITKTPIKRDTIKLYHLSHISDRGNINYFDNDEYIRNNY